MSEATAPPRTPFQQRLVDTLAKLPNCHCTATVLARRMATSRLAVCAAAWALQRQGWVTTFRSNHTEHASLMVAISHSKIKELKNAKPTK